MHVAIRWIATGALGVAGLLGSSDALAQRDETNIGGRRQVPESPQNFAIELRGAPFRPEVDSDPALHGATPYQHIFGNSERLLISAEFDWQAYRIPYVGTIGPGVSVGYARMSDPAPLTTPVNGMIESGETTTLEIFPFYAAIVLRADTFWRRWHIPLVPYGKLGLAYAIWRASNTLGTSHFQGVAGNGGSLGSVVALGLSFNLNLFDTYAAREFDESLGVNGSYVFAEFSRMDLAGLGLQSDPLRVGGNAWTFGLAFEF
jgi:hypothetical protein